MVRWARDLSWKAALVGGAGTGLTALIIRLIGVGAASSLSMAHIGLMASGGAVVAFGIFYPLATAADRVFSNILKRLISNDNDNGAALLSATPAWLRSATTEFENALADRMQMERDISVALKESEIRQHVAEASRGHLESVLHSLRDAVVVTDGFNEIVLANESASELFGLNGPSALNGKVEDVIPEQQIVQMIQSMRDSGNVAARRSFEHEINDRNDDRILEVSLSCIPDQSQSGGGVVTILHDVTHERQVSEMKTDIVSKTSHELRTPLSLIKAYIEMLIDGEAQDEESKIEFYHIIQTEAERLERTINNMLNISRIEAGITHGEWDECDVKGVINDVVELSTPRAQEKKIAITHKQSQLCTVAEADRDMIQQVIMNLVSNAIKYSPEGGRITLTTGSSDCDRSILVTVADTGLGIPPDAIPKLFDKFYRIKNYDRVAHGTGLGLNLVKQIVERIHGGEIGVESELGMGSKFWFTIPCKRAA